MAETRRSINRRLTRTVIATTAGLLLLACGAIVWLDWSSFRESMTARARTLADVVGSNSGAALSFLDAESARQTLAALDAVEPVVAAVIYDETRREFARFVRSADRNGVPPAGGPSQELRDGYLDLRRPIVFGGSRIGTIAIRWDTREMTQRALSVVGIAMLLLVLSTAVGLLLSARLRRQISQPLSELVSGSEAIAGGNLASRVDVATDDEIGVLARTFNRMTDGLRALVQQVDGGTREVGEVARLLEEHAESLQRQAGRQTTAIEDSTESVSRFGESIRGVNEHVEQLSEAMNETSSSIIEMQTSMNEIAGHMEHLSSSIDTTSSAVSQVADNTVEVASGLGTLKEAAGNSVDRLERLRQSVRRVTEDARASHESSKDASTEATRGLDAVNETIDAMGAISTSFHELEQTISRLARNSSSIDEVLKVLRTVAEQTSMLSLNASIIAAQAGEHGKAFAVVADEVNNLARSTHQSTHQIAELIRTFQDDTAAAVAAVNEGASRVESGVQRSNVAGEVLRLISEKSHTSTERVGAILEAAGVQIEDLQKVYRAVEAVNETAERFERSARDQQVATSEIAASIQGIRDLGLSVNRSVEEQRRGGLQITNAVTDVSKRIASIGEATQSQTESSESIERSLQVFRDVTAETSRRVQAIHEVVATLSERARRLEGEVRRFQLD